MAHHGKSGRIVIDVEPELKRRLYAALSLSGSTLKEWFVRAGEEFCEEKKQPSFFRQVRYGRGKHSAPLVVREEFDQRAPVPPTLNGNGKSGKKYTVVSMFSGCGGMDLGFTGGFEVFGRRYRSLPFDIIWANDLNSEACKTYRRNLGHEIHRGLEFGQHEPCAAGQKYCAFDSAMKKR
jgi:hypothetical protein